MSMHWILVADNDGARFYEGDAQLDELTLVEEVKQGHGKSLPGAGHGASEAHHDPHLVREERFARSVALFVNEASDSHRFERLVVVAPPHFLGDLRGEFSNDVTQRVVASIHHDWTHLSRRDLATSVKKHLSDVAGTS